MSLTFDAILPTGRKTHAIQNQPVEHAPLADETDHGFCESRPDYLSFCVGSRQGKLSIGVRGMT